MLPSSAHVLSVDAELQRKENSKELSLSLSGTLSFFHKSTLMSSAEERKKSSKRREEPLLINLAILPTSVANALGAMDRMTEIQLGQLTGSAKDQSPHASDLKCKMHSLWRPKSR